MSKDLEVLLRTTYLGAIMMTVSRNTLKEEASNNKNTEDTHSRDGARTEETPDTATRRDRLRKNNNQEETEEKHFIKKAEKLNN